MTVTDVNGCTATDDVFVKVYANNDVHVPGAFNYNNGDGINDMQTPRLLDLKKIEYFLYLQPLRAIGFETHQLDKGWDGTFKGRLNLPALTLLYENINYRNRAVEKQEPVY